MEVDTTGWDLVGETANCRYFRVEQGVLAAIPHAGTDDDLASATANVAFQTEYFDRLGRPGVVLVFFDAMTSQSKEARTVYQTIEGHSLRATAIIASTLLGRAIASWFLGVSKPTMPVRLFAGVDDALSWAREVDQSSADESRPT